MTELNTESGEKSLPPKTSTIDPRSISVPESPRLETPVAPDLGKQVVLVGEAKEPVSTGSQLRRISTPLCFPDPPLAGAKTAPATIANLGYLLDMYGVGLRFNVIKKRIEIDIPGHTSTPQNRDNVTLTVIESIAAKHGLSTARLPDFVMALADRNPYNPVAAWIESKPWDGVSRLPEICATLTEEEGYPPGLKDTLIRKWLLSAVAAALKPTGYHGRGVLTLQGKQGLGKSSFFKSLIPIRELADDVIKLGHHFDGSKDQKLGAIRNWIVELGELEGSFRKEIQKLKSFITDDYDKIRPPFFRVEAEFPRQTVFGASVNDREFLLDASGNSRFWTIPVIAIDYKHNVDMQQVFAELKGALDNGEQWWLTKEEDALLDLQNQQHRSHSAVAERVMAALDLSMIGRSSNPRMTATKVLSIVGIERPTNTQSKECSALLRQHLGEPTRSQGYYWWRIPFAPEYYGVTLAKGLPDEDVY